MHPRSLTCILLLCVGCGDGLPVAPVSGSVTFEGKPLVGASITTQPIASGSDNPGSGFFATTDEQGHFELELVKPAVNGAIIGEHRVMISQAAGEQTANQPKKTEDGVEGWADDPNAHRARVGAASKWPARFTDGTLRLTVPPEGLNDADFDLSLKAGR